MKGSAGLAAFICIRKLFFKILVKVFANTNNTLIFVLPNAMKRAGKQSIMTTIKLNADSSVKKADWGKIESLPIGTYEDTRIASSGHEFRVYPVTWLTKKRIVCQTNGEFQTEIKL